MRSLLLYSTYDGQAKTIATVIANEIAGEIDYDLVDINDAHTVKLEEYQSVLIGASIRYGHFNRAVQRFTQKHSVILNCLPSAFFSVTLTARKLEKRSPQTNSYTRKFLASTPWRPDECGVFAGALHYPRYRWFDRVMIQFIMRITGGETDTTKDIEYTDWEQVREFARRFIVLTQSNKNAK